jgi:hypothetical protein
VPGHAQLGVPRGQAMPALAAVIPGAADAHRAQHRVHGLAPVGDKPRLVPSPAVHGRAAVTGISGEQAFQQAAAQLGQPGAKRQLYRLQAAATGQARRCRRRQPPYLGGRFRRERLTEPPFCPSASRAWLPAAGAAGRASQIASFTSTICSESAANSW